MKEGGDRLSEEFGWLEDMDTKEAKGGHSGR